MEALRNREQRRELALFALGCGAVGAVIGAAIAVRVGRRDRIGQYAIAASGSVTLGSLGFQITRRALLARQPSDEALSKTFAVRSTLASAQAGAVWGAGFGTLALRSLYGTLAYGTLGAALGGTGQMAVLFYDRYQRSTPEEWKSFLENFRLRDTGPTANRARPGPPDPTAPPSEESNPLFDFLDAVSEWSNKHLQPPEWAYLVEGPQEKRLNDEIARLEAEVAALRAAMASSDSPPAQSSSLSS